MPSFEQVAIWGPWFLAPLLICVIYYDLRYMRLPNSLSILFVVVFAVSVAWAIPFAELAWRIAAALIVLLIGVAAHATKLLGGGDVKVLAALVLFIPRSDYLSFAFILCVCTFLGILGVLALRRALSGRDIRWTGLRQSGRYPLGLSIGAAGLISVFLVS